MQRWVENALVQHNRDGKGCPQSTYNTAIHSFGLLDAAPCPSAAEMNCWTMQALKINNTTINDNPSWITARVGDPLEVNLTYRYEMPLLGGVFNANPILIQKRVIMRMQNN